MATQASALSPRYRAFLQQQQGVQPQQGIDAAAQPDSAYSDAASVYNDPSNPFANLNVSPLASSQTSTPAPAGPYGNVSAPPTLNLQGQGGVGDSHNDILWQAYNNQNLTAQQGQQLQNEGLSQLQYYGPLQQQAQQEEQAALQQLQQTPGYTDPEASQINVNYGQYNTPTSALQSQFLTPDEQSSISGNPNAPVDSLNQGVYNEGQQLAGYGANLGGQINAYGENLSGQVGNYANYTKGALDTLDTGTGTAVGNLKSGLQGAQAGFSKLDSAVNNPGLSFDPNNTERQLTDADVQEMETAAGTTVGNSYRTAEDQLQRNAAAAGNTSPLAIAAANARLQTQEASQQGDAEVNAEIAAKQAQQSRAAAIEAQREGAVQTQTGLQAGAATTEQSQAQNAAALAGTQGLTAAELEGTQGITAAENVGQAGINAANTYGAAALDTANKYGTAALNTQTNMTNQSYGAQSTAEQLAAARAAQLAANRQTTQTGVNTTQYNQGTGSAQLTSGGAQTVGNSRIAGQGAYRSGVAGQQAAAQQGGQAAVGQQQSAYGTQTTGLNSSTATAANMKTNQPSVIGDITGLAKAFGAKDGEVISEPSIRLVGEDGPEWIAPVQSRSRYRQGERMAA